MIIKEIRVDFTDFWPDFIKTNNYFYNLLIQKYKVVIDEINPEILFYSCHGEKYVNYKCKRVFFTGENVRPDFTACDFAFSFDYNSKKNHYRLPLYSLYIDHHNMLGQLLKTKNREEAAVIWASKTKFCCMVVSNPKCKKRLEFFDTLSTIKKVDSGGKVYNNVGGMVDDKYEFIKDYKFVISFENNIYDGYTTEKLLESIYKDCIPIYWGNRLVHKDFNHKRYLDYNNFKTEEDLIAKLIEIDSNDALAIDMIMEPPFPDEKVSHEEEHVQVLKVLINVIENNKKIRAIGFWGIIHSMKLQCNKIQKKNIDFNKRVFKKIKLTFLK